MIWASAGESKTADTKKALIERLSLIQMGCANLD
jgi:hypothetical protein